MNTRELQHRTVACLAANGAGNAWKIGLEQVEKGTQVSYWNTAVETEACGVWVVIDLLAPNAQTRIALWGLQHTQHTLFTY